MTVPTVATQAPPAAKPAATRSDRMPGGRASRVRTIAAARHSSMLPSATMRSERGTDRDSPAIHSAARAANPAASTAETTFIAGAYS